MEPLDRPLVSFRLPEICVQPDRLDDLVANGVHLAERGHRLLKDHRYRAAPERPHLRVARTKGSDVHFQAPTGRPQKHLAPLDAARPVDNLQDRPGGNALPAPTLPNQAQRATVTNVEAGAVYCLDHALIGEEVGHQIPHCEEGLLRFAAIAGCGLLRCGCFVYGRQFCHFTFSRCVGVCRIPQAVTHEVEGQDNDNYR